MRWRLPRRAETYRLWRPPHPPAFLWHVGDFLAALFVAVVFSVFFYAANDGIPRLFSFVGAVFGAVFFKKTLGRPFAAFATRLGGLVRYAVLLLLLPPLIALVTVGKHFLTYLIKVGVLLIKKQKKLYTNHKSRRYVKRVASAASRAGLVRRIRSALDREEGEEGGV